MLVELDILFIGHVEVFVHFFDVAEERAALIHLAPVAGGEHFANALLVPRIGEAAYFVREAGLFGKGYRRCDFPATVAAAVAGEFLVLPMAL